MPQSASPENDALRDAEHQARKRVREERDFYSHLASYLVVNLFLVSLNLWTGGGFWAIWPLLGWGIGLVSHAVSVYGLFGIGSKEWEERKVRELVMRSEQLTADQVRQMLRQELPSAGQVDTERIVRRLEHLEAIVTSRDWDELEAMKPPALRVDAADEPPAPEDPQAEAARLARRVR
jgi:hypothetical protein